MSNPGSPFSFKEYKKIIFELSNIPSNLIFLKLIGLLPLNSTGSLFKDWSIEFIKSSFQFNLTICQVPNDKKTKIKKYTKIEKDNLFFKNY